MSVDRMFWVSSDLELCPMDAHGDIHTPVDHFVVHGLQVTINHLLPLRAGDLFTVEHEGNSWTVARYRYLWSWRRLCRRSERTVMLQGWPGELHAWVAQ